MTVRTRFPRRFIPLCGIPLAAFLLLELPAGATTTLTRSQERAERFRQWSKQHEQRGLAEPFAGVTTGGEVLRGLFPIRSTGVSTTPVREAAEVFLATLTPEQRSATQFPVDDPEWRKWMNQHFYVRQGISFREMIGPQRDAALPSLCCGRRSAPAGCGSRATSCVSITLWVS